MASTPHCYSNTEYRDGFRHGYFILTTKRLIGKNTGSGVMVYMFMEITGVTAIKDVDEEIMKNTANPIAVVLSDKTYTHATTLFPDGSNKTYRRRYCCRMFFYDRELTDSNVAALNRFFAFKNPITDEEFKVCLMKSSLVRKENGLMPKACTLDVTRYIAQELKEIVCNAGVIYDALEEYASQLRDYTENEDGNENEDEYEEEEE